MISMADITCWCAIAVDDITSRLKIYPPPQRHTSQETQPSSLIPPISTKCVAKIRTCSRWQPFEIGTTNAAENTTHTLETVLRYHWQPFGGDIAKAADSTTYEQFKHREVSMFSMAAIHNSYVKVAIDKPCTLRTVLRSHR